MDIYYVHEIINPTDTAFKRVQNTLCRIVCMYFIQWFFPIFSGCLIFLNNFSSSVILLDFEDVEQSVLSLVSKIKTMISVYERTYK